MKSLLDKVEELDYLVRQLEKMNSKMHAGNWIDAWRENCRLISHVSKHRQNLINSAECEPDDPTDHDRLDGEE